MATEEHLRLKLEANTNEWQAAFTQSKAGAAVLGTEVGKTTKEFNKAEEAARKLGVETKKTASYAELLHKGLESYNKVAAAFGTVGRIAQGAVDLAKFSVEMKRLETVIPVETMRKLEEETKGTVSKMELLQRAAKEMGVSATAGMDEQALALQKGLADWTNFVDQAKASIGGLIQSAIVGIVDLSNAIGNAISGEEQLRRTAGLAAENAAERARQGQNWAAFDAAKAPELNDRTKQYFEQEAAQQLGIGKVFPKGVAAFVKGYKPPRRGGRGGGGDGGDFWGGLLTPTSPGLAGAISGASDTLGQWGQSANGVGGAFSSLGSAIGGIGGGLGGAYEGAAGGVRGNLAAQKAATEEMSNMLTDRSKLVGGAFGAFTDGLSAAVDAAITGSESIGKAFMKASAAALKSLAIESTVRAAYNLAMGIGAAVINPSAAPGFFAAAGQFALTATLAGAGAAALGGGGGGGASTGPGSAPGGGALSHGGGGSQPQSQTTIVQIYGAVTAGDYQKLGGVITKATDAANRAGRSSGDQTVKTRIE